MSVVSDLLSLTWVSGLFGACFKRRPTFENSVGNLILCEDLAAMINFPFSIFTPLSGLRSLSGKSSNLVNTLTH